MAYRNRRKLLQFFEVFARVGNKECGNHAKGSWVSRIEIEFLMLRVNLMDRLAKGGMLDMSNTLYTEDFEEGAFGWSHVQRSNLGTLGDVLGRFDKDEDVTKTFAMRTEASSLKIEFDFIEMDSWDHEHFSVWINGTEVKLGTFRFDATEEKSGGNGNITWSFTSGARAHHGGHTDFMDQVHRVSISINDSNILAKDTLTLKFDAKLNEQKENESYAIDNLSISGNHNFKHVVTSDNFRETADGWSLTSRTKIGTKVLGRFDGSQDPEKTIKVPDLTEVAVVTFDFIEVDSWDHEEFVVWINGTEVSLETFHFEANEGSKSGVTDGISWEFTSNPHRNFTGKSWDDQKHFVTMYIPKQYLFDDGFNIRFDSRTDEGLWNESFAIDNFVVEALPSKSVVVAAESFNLNALGWSVPELGLDLGRDGGRFLGRFDKDVDVEKTFDLPAGVASLRVEFDFIEIDSWNHEYFVVWINDTEVSLETFHHQANEGSKSGVTNGISWAFTSDMHENFMASSWDDQKHYVTMDIPASLLTGDTVTIKFDARTDADIDNESYAIDNFVMKARVEVGQEVKDWASSEVIFEENFSWSSSSHWDKSLTEGTAGSVSSEKMLGRFSGAQDITYGATFSNYDLKYGGILTFVVNEVDDWDGEEFIVTVNGHRISLGRFSASIDEGSKAGAGNGLRWSYTTSTNNAHGFGEGDDQSYNYINSAHNVKIIFDQNVLSGHILSLGFDAKLDDSLNNESFGIDNIKLVGDSEAVSTAAGTQSEFASGHINRGNSLDAGDELVRGEALVSSDYSTALFLNRSGEVNILHDADGDGDYESSTPLFGAGLDGFDRVGFRESDGAIFAEKSDGSQYHEIVNDNQVSVGHRMVVRSKSSGSNSQTTDDSAIIATEIDGSTILTINRRAEVDTYTYVTDFIHDRFRVGTDGWYNTSSGN